MIKDKLPQLSIPKPPRIFRVLCLGDVVGKGGVAAIRRQCRKLRETLELDFVIANGENASGGVGIDAESIKSFLSNGVDIITLGDHVWSKRDIVLLFKENSPEKLRCIRPANYPPGSPGEGMLIASSATGVQVAVFNLLGRTFSPYFLDCPFRSMDKLLERTDPKVKIRILDFHCEATSEKAAMGRYVDGDISLMVGTHTHVLSADEQILPEGTGFITDLGMCGAYDGVIGMDTETALKRFISGMPHSYKGATGGIRISGVVADIDLENGSTIQIEQLNTEVKI